MAADSERDVEEVELADGDTLRDRLDEIEFDDEKAHSVAEMREKLNLED
ncbi:hypothetical protein [Halorussus litoreus]|nr:hypothetical protein [Halorussus litoreus]